MQGLTGENILSDKKIRIIPDGTHPEQRNNPNRSIKTPNQPRPLPKNNK